MEEWISPTRLWGRREGFWEGTTAIRYLWAELEGFPGKWKWARTAGWPDSQSPMGWKHQWAGLGEFQKFLTTFLINGILKPPIAPGTAVSCFQVCSGHWVPFVAQHCEAARPVTSAWTFGMPAHFVGITLSLYSLWTLPRSTHGICGLVLADLRG